MMNKEFKVLKRMTIFHRDFNNIKYKLEDPENITTLNEDASELWLKTINRLSKDLLKGYNVDKIDLRKKMKDVFLFIDDSSCCTVLVRFYNDYTSMEIRYIDRSGYIYDENKLVKTSDNIQNMDDFVVSMFVRELEVILNHTKDSKKSAYIKIHQNLSRAINKTKE